LALALPAGRQAALASLLALGVCACTEAREISLSGARFVLRGQTGRLLEVFTPDRPPRPRIDGCRTSTVVETDWRARTVDADIHPELPDLLEGRLRAACLEPVDDGVVRGESFLWMKEETARLADPPWGTEQSGTQEAPETLSGWSSLGASMRAARTLARDGLRIEAAQEYLAGAKHARRLGVPSEEARRKLAAGFQYVWALDLDEASAMVQAVRTTAEGLSTDDIAWSHYLQGVLWSEVGDRLRARAEFDRALSLWPADQPKDDTFGIRLGLANLETELGRPREALRILGAVEEELGPGLPKGGRASLEQHLGNAKAILHSVEQEPAHARAALVHLLTAAKLQEELGAKPELVTTLIAIAQVELGLGRPDRAEKLIERVARLSPKLQALEAEGFELLQGEVWLALGELERAEAALLASLERSASRGLGVTRLSWRTKHQLARLRVRQGRTREAASLFLEAIAERQALAARVPIQTGRPTFLDDPRGLTTDAVEFFWSRGDRRMALQISEAERISFLSALDAETRRSRLSEQQQIDFSRRVAAYHEVMRRLRSAKAKLSESLEDRESAQRTHDELQVAARRAFERIFELLDRAGVGLPPNRRRALAVRADAPALTAIRREDGSLDYTLLTTDQVFALSAETLVEDVLEDLPKPTKSLTVVPVAGTPLETFHEARTSGGALLLERVAVSFVPSLLLPSGPSSPSLEDNRLAVIDPTDDLPKAKEEIANLPEAFVLLEGEAATRTAVLDGSEDLELFHFSGHGVLEPESPWDAYLALAGGDQLTLEDILVSRIRARLVVLNGCDTGTKAKLSRKQLIGLADAFLTTGSTHVLASDEKISDSGALAFIGLFYEERGLQEPIQAYRRAALAAEEGGLEEWRAYRLHGFHGRGP